MAAFIVVFLRSSCSEICRKARTIQRHVLKTNSQMDVSNEQNGTDRRRRRCNAFLSVPAQVFLHDRAMSSFNAMSRISASQILLKKCTFDERTSHEIDD